MSKNLSIWNITLLATLYTTQYLGLAFFTEAFVTILRQTGVSLENLGLIYMLGLFWIIRFLWAPFIDRFSFKKLGHYRGWIIIFQSFMALILALISLFDLLNSLQVVLILSVLFSFFSASQAVALDALVFKTVSLKHRATANALKSSGGMLGMILGGGMGLIVYHHFGWKYTMLILSFLTAISLVQIMFYKEPKKERDNDELKINYKQYLNFWRTKRRKQWLVFLIIYPISISCAFALTSPMLVDLKWSLQKIGLYVNIIGYSIGVFASFTASWLINKYGKRKLLIVAAMGQVIGLLLLLLLQNGYNNEYLVISIIGFIFSFYTPAAVVLTTIMMDECSSKTPASQFAVQHSINMFAGILSSGLAISFSGMFGYSNVIVFVALLGLITIFASFKIELIKE